MKKTRNRKPRPEWSYSGLTSELWRSEPSRVGWAQRSQEFRDLLTVMTNERASAFMAMPGTTENCKLGRVEGYEIALKTLRELAMGIDLTPHAEPKADYQQDPLDEPMND